MKRAPMRLTAALGACLLTGLLPGLQVFAEDVPQTYTDETLTYEKINGGVKLTHVDAGQTAIIIPEKYGGFPVLEIGEYAFSDCAALKKVEIRSNLELIDTGAFSECTALTDVTFTGTVKAISDGAFYYCGSLETLTLPDSVEQIGTYAFAYCFSLREITLPASLKTLSPYAFYYDSALETVHMNDALENISAMAFVRCDAMKALEIPASVTMIDPYAFISCSALEEIKVAAGNTAYSVHEDGVLFDTAGETLMLYPAAREGKSYTVSDGVTAIGAYAFSGAADLTEITLPDSITSLGEGAFSGCKGLTQFTLPPKVTAIAGTLLAETGLTSFTIPDGVTEIGDYAFYRCAGLTGIRIPESVTKIGAVAFFNCTGIKEIAVPDSVTEIGENALGFRLDPDAADGESIILQEDFVLRGGSGSAAKTYASENGIKFKQNGLRWGAVIAVAAALLVILLIVVFIMLGERKKTANSGAGAENVPAPEEEYDTNYTSILGGADDSADPYERSDTSGQLSGEEREKLESEEFPDD